MNVLPVPAPVPKGYVPKNNGQVPIIHYCQFLSIPINRDETEGGKEHVPGYSFGKYDYADGFSFAELGRGLLRCPPRSHDIHLAAPSAYTPAAPPDPHCHAFSLPQPEPFCPPRPPPLTGPLI